MSGQWWGGEADPELAREAFRLMCAAERSTPKVTDPAEVRRLLEEHRYLPRTKRAGRVWVRHRAPVEVTT